MRVLRFVELRRILNELSEAQKSTVTSVKEVNNFIDDLFGDNLMNFLDLDDESYHNIMAERAYDHNIEPILNTLLMRLNLFLPEPENFDLEAEKPTQYHITNKDFRGERLDYIVYMYNETDYQKTMVVKWIYNDGNLLTRKIKSGSFKPTKATDNESYLLSLFLDSENFELRFDVKSKGNKRHYKNQDIKCDRLSQRMRGLIKKGFVKPFRSSIEAEHLISVGHEITVIYKVTPKGMQAIAAKSKMAIDKIRALELFNHSDQVVFHTGWKYSECKTHPGKAKGLFEALRREGKVIEKIEKIGDNTNKVTYTLIK